MNKTMAIAASLIATATLFAVTPGVASASTESSAIAVRYADLDLSTVDGQRTLDRRIARAARTVCGMDLQQTGTRMTPPETVSCYRQALSDVRQRVAAAIENGRKGG